MDDSRARWHGWAFLKSPQEEAPYLLPRGQHARTRLFLLVEPDRAFIFRLAMHKDNCPQIGMILDLDCI